MVTTLGMHGGEGRGGGGRGRGTGAAFGATRGLPSTAAVGDEAQPMIELNTTPLIDVMLVLLVMLIITIPSQTHQVPINLPGKVVPHPPPDPLRNKLTISAAGVTRWNGIAVGDRALTQIFRDVAAMERPAEVHFEPDAAARYERVDTVLAMASRSGVETLGFVGNERYRDSF